MELLKFVKVPDKDEYRIYYTGDNNSDPDDDLFIMAEIYKSDLVDDGKQEWCVMFNEEVIIKELREVLTFMEGLNAN